jgi:DivIVA domain-containing protein
MPLTPADVHNVAFSKPPIGKRGYNEDEVDAFLDLVEAELARLIEENEDLREQVSQLEQRLGNAQADLEEVRSRPAPMGAVSPPTQQIQRQEPPLRQMEPQRGG